MSEVRILDMMLKPGSVITITGGKLTFAPMTVTKLTEKRRIVVETEGTAKHYSINGLLNELDSYRCCGYTVQAN